MVVQQFASHACVLYDLEHSENTKAPRRFVRIETAIDGRNRSLAGVKETGGEQPAVTPGRDFESACRHTGRVA